jgi:RimJ/RimL family protein N-acetyltransferase
VSLSGENDRVPAHPVTTDVRLDDQHVLTWRTTPWDAAVFGYATGEILRIRYAEPERLAGLIERFLAERRQAGQRLCVTRVPADERVLRRALMAAGFVQVETALRMTHARIARSARPPAFADDLVLTAPLPEDRPALVAIARDAFHHSRFHEDPFVDLDLARRRYQRWMEGLLGQQTPLWVHRTESEVDAFVAFSREDSAVELLLAGSAVGRGLVTPSFLASALRRFRDEGVTRVATTISAANRAILDIYARLGFQTEQTLFGYHLHDPEKE